MIFISGIHGVGKTYFCNIVKEELGIATYSSSELIEKRKKEKFPVDKLVADIHFNQILLIDAVNELLQSGEEFIIDGHFCLLDANGKISRIPIETYEFLKPNKLILLTEEPKIIVERRYKRDGILQNELDVKKFQEEEKMYAYEVAQKLDIKLKISRGKQELKEVLEFIERGCD